VNLSDYLDARRRDVEAALPGYLPPADECPAVLLDAMRYSLLGGGKRLRPILCLAACDAVGGDRTQVMAAACAIEMIHTYSLVHDDLPAMDNDTMRRGRPTLHVVAGDGQAILAGDGLLTFAFHVLARSPQPNDARQIDRTLDAIQILSAAAGPSGMVGGQAMDLACVTPDPQGRLAPPLDADGLRRMHGKKTAALIRVSATIGAILGGGAHEQITAIDDAAGEFGYAFQIVDDILDVEGSSAELGKTAGKDAAAGKPTYPSMFGLETSKRMAAECLAKAEASLAGVNLADSHLMAIGRWIIERRN
jgi:geranylgeranyl pyrophosphate synthase